MIKSEGEKYAAYAIFEGSHAEFGFDTFMDKYLEVLNVCNINSHTRFPVKSKDEYAEGDILAYKFGNKWLLREYTTKFSGVADIGDFPGMMGFPEVCIYAGYEIVKLVDHHKLFNRYDTYDNYMDGIYVTYRFKNNHGEVVHDTSKIINNSGEWLLSIGSAGMTMPINFVTNNDMIISYDLHWLKH